jgi:hypothetical protein
MSGLSSDTKKHTTKSRETIPLTIGGEKGGEVEEGEVTTIVLIPDAKFYTC